MLFFLIVILLPALFTGGGVALLASAFTRSGHSQRRRIAGALVLFLATGALIFVTDSGGGYSALGATYQLVAAWATALVGALILVLKPPATRRLTALLLITAYPMVLMVLILAGSALTR